MKKVAGLLIAGSLLFQANALDVEDKVLEAKKLSDAEIASFAEDGAISAFWSDWASQDSTVMYPETNTDPNAGLTIEEDDCSIVFKVAAANGGLYVFASVSDNIAVDPTPGDDAWQYDAVDMYFNARSAEAIRNLDPDDIDRLGFGGNTIHTTQIVLSMGGATAPTTARINSGDILAPFGGGMSQQDVDFESLRAAGYKFDIVTSGNVRSVEWFIPWGLILVTQDFVDANSRMIAFTGGYNDLDGAEGGPVMKLRWKEGSDPFNTGDRGNNAWGDIKIPDGVQIESNIGVKNDLFKKAITGKVAKTHYFTLSGKSIPAAKVTQIKGASVIERHVLTNGKIMSRIINK
jgi:hypothetical protein